MPLVTWAVAQRNQPAIVDPKKGLLWFIDMTLAVYGVLHQWTSSIVSKQQFFQPEFALDR